MSDDTSATYFELDQLIGCRLGEDLMLDYSGPYSAAEDWVTERSAAGLMRLVAEIDFIFDLEPDTASRLRHFHTDTFNGKTDTFDVWLRAVQRRAREAIAGIHSNPLVDPEP